MMNKESILSLSLEHQSFTAEMRHKLHEIPELQWEEEKTLALISSEIEKIMTSSKVPIQLHQKEGGIYVDVDLDPHYQRLLFRADIDALPIEEQTGLSYSSIHPGIMHACGHDCHSAMLLGTLKALASGKVTPLHNLRLVWQRAEEIGVVQSGGARLVEEGILEGISYCYGLHISSTEDYGTFISRPGYFMCQAGQLQVEIECSGGHVMRPEFGSNGIDIMMDIHMSLRGFELRKLGPNEIISFVPSISKAGTACNIRPGHAEMWYAVRNFLSPERLEEFIAAIKYRIELIVKSYPKAHLATFIYYPGYPPLINDPENYTFIKSLIQDAGMNTSTVPFLFSGEDFSYYLENRVGSYWCLGARKGERTDHHTATFNPDESVLWQGVAFWLLIATAPHPPMRQPIEKGRIELMSYP
ncbi:MAG: amidohydrolase [Simkania sp.]|nr:amidohydrolase [Simkania sp.]MCB1083061.1 amidohydrolase [Simkania sp.]